MSSKTSKHALLGPSIANFSVQYNFQVIAISLEIAARVTHQQSWVVTQNMSVIFIGCILGQFTMGYAGDLIGRSRALSLTLCIAAAGAIGSAAAAWGSPSAIYGTVIAFRLVIGYGLGGVYPLSATKAAESDDSNSVGSTAWAFFWQGPGMCAPYVLALLFRAVLRSKLQGLQWRGLLGLGAVPALLVVVMSDTSADKAASSADTGRAALSVASSSQLAMSTSCKST